MMKVKLIIGGVSLLCIFGMVICIFTMRDNNEYTDTPETMIITRDNGIQEEVPVIGYSTAISVRDGQEIEIETPVPNLDTLLARDEEDEIIITDDNFEHAIEVFAQEFFWGDPEYDLTGVKLVHIIEAKSECSEIIPVRRYARFEKDGEFAGSVELKLDSNQWKWVSVNFTNASLKDGVEFRFDPANEVPKTVDEARRNLPDEYKYLQYSGTIFPCVDGIPGNGTISMHAFGSGDDRILIGTKYDTIFSQRELRERWEQGKEDAARVQKMWDEEDERQESTLPQRLEDAHRQVYSYDFEEREGAISIISDPEILVDIATNHNDENTRYASLERMAKLDSDNEEINFADVMYTTVATVGSSVDEREEAILYFINAVGYAPEKSFETLEQIVRDSVLTVDEYDDITSVFDSFNGSCDSIVSCKLFAHTIKDHDHFSSLSKDEQKNIIAFAR